jgi:Sec-independent protein translocase protein TatA
MSNCLFISLIIMLIILIGFIVVYVHKQIPENYSDVLSEIEKYKRGEGSDDV